MQTMHTICVLEFVVGCWAGVDGSSSALFRSRVELVFRDLTPCTCWLAGRLKVTVILGRSYKVK